MKNETHILKETKKTLEGMIPKTDNRCNIGPLEFIVNLIFCYSGDTKKTSLEAIRRKLMVRSKKRISRSAFWERMSGQRLKKLLLSVVSGLMLQLSEKALNRHEILSLLGVSGALILDSCSFSLWDSTKDKYPGVFTTAGIKWHACFDLLSGVLSWFELSPATVHDRNCVPGLPLLKGKLITFDLGYFDYALLLAIKLVDGYFLSRVKTSAVLRITKVVQGLPKTYMNKSINSINLKKRNPKKHKDIVEVVIQKKVGDKQLICRAIGFWNTSEYKYHRYLTNLVVPAEVIYSLYRLRWQIELIFKGAQQSLNADRFTSGNSNIIESLILASLAAQLISTVILKVGSTCLSKQEKLARSFQRIAKIACDLAVNFISFFLKSTKKALDNLIKQIILLAPEIFDPNYGHRETSLMRLQREITNGT